MRKSSIDVFALVAVISVWTVNCRVQAATAVTDLRVFVGTWKENQAKSRSFLSTALTYTFTAEPDGFFTIVRGGVQLRDRVRMDGADYPTPDIAGRTASLKMVTDTAYESTVKRNGMLLATIEWVPSDGAGHLTQTTTPIRADGDNDVDIIEYVRTSGSGNSLLGTWTPLSTRSAVPDLFVMTLNGDELSAFYPKYGFVVYTIRPDGTRYPFDRRECIARSGDCRRGDRWPDAATNDVSGRQARFGDRHEHLGRWQDDDGDDTDLAVLMNRPCSSTRSRTDPWCTTGAPVSVARRRTRTPPDVTRHIPRRPTPFGSRRI